MRIGAPGLRGFMSFSNADRDAGRERADSFGDAGGPRREPPPSNDPLESGIQLTVAARNRAPFRPLETEFDVSEQVGEGAFGVVYRAIERSTGRTVAVKRLHAIRRDGDLERLQLEMKAIVQLSHPHIIQLYRFQQDRGGHYLVLEWAAGGSLENRIASGEVLALNEVIDLARKLGSALAYAHRRQIIHRDIKPGNILLTDSGEPKLADFGLAISPSSGTRTSSSGGSLLYAAPEQFAAPDRVSGQSIDGRADLFALGKTLYHLATGHAPVSVHIDRSLPRPLRRVIARCVESDPARRYASAEAFLADLERANRDSLLADAGETAFGWLSAKARRTLAGVALAIVAVVGVVATFAGRGDEPVARAAEPELRCSLVAVSGAIPGDEPGTLRVLRSDGELRLRLDPAPAGIASRDVRFDVDGFASPISVDAEYSAPVLRPPAPGRYAIRAVLTNEPSRVLARTTLIVAIAN
jgi:eukaryotic-like serine/threonine-protein kinase